MPNMYKDGNVCQADKSQVELMKKAGWSLSSSTEISDFGLDDTPTPEPETAELPGADVSKMRKKELLDYVRNELNYDVDDSWTVTQLRELAES